MKRMLFTCLTLCGVAMAMSLSSFSKTFDEVYKVKKGSNLSTAACGVCHVKKTGGKLNAYGHDLQVALKAAGAKKVTAEILAKVENLDSNKNGKKNIDEIKGDCNPGAEK